MQFYKICTKNQRHPGISIFYKYHSSPPRIHKSPNPLLNSLGTRPLRTNMRVKPKPLPQKVPRRRSNSRDKDILPPSLPICTSKRSHPKNPKHPLTPRRRKNNHPNTPPFPSIPVSGYFPANHIPEINLKRIHFPCLINDNLINVDPLGFRFRQIHECFRDDISALFADEEEEGWFCASR